MEQWILAMGCRRCDAAAVGGGRSIAVRRRLATSAGQVGAVRPGDGDD